MYLTISDIILFTLLAVLAFLWWHHQAVRQIARRHARKHCQERGLQFLDENVAIRISGLKRDIRGQLSICRTGQFEFSATGDDRYKGQITMLGRRVLDIQLPPHRIDSPPFDVHQN